MDGLLGSNYSKQAEPELLFKVLHVLSAANLPLGLLAGPLCLETHP